MNDIDYQINSNIPPGFDWINKPGTYSLDTSTLSILTNPETDFWQRTFYGFQNDNGHAFLKDMEGDFTFSVKTGFKAVNQYDQCGIILYHDPQNWVKASVEYEDEDFVRLGSVVTNLGYSDWASTDIPADVNTMWYRLSRRGQDFRIEYSADGEHFLQMRIFHLHVPLPIARAGVYACSPLKSSFRAVFSHFELGTCKWPEHH